MQQRDGVSCLNRRLVQFLCQTAVFLLVCYDIVIKIYRQFIDFWLYLCYDVYMFMPKGEKKMDSDDSDTNGNKFNIPFSLMTAYLHCMFCLRGKCVFLRI